MWGVCTSLCKRDTTTEKKHNKMSAIIEIWHSCLSGAITKKSLTNQIRKINSTTILANVSYRNRDSY